MFHQYLVTFVMAAVFSIPACHAQTSGKIKIYMAAGLFNGRENHFNLIMNQHMENRGYATILPLRDGFEDRYFEKAAKKYLSPTEITQAARELVYLRDIGIFIPESDVILANLDEPMDEGVIIEIAYAHLMGKPVIGFRTDVRTPYGGSEGIAGIHSFVGMQCDYFISQYLPGQNSEQLNQAIATLAAKIDTLIKQKIAPVRQHGIPDYALANPRVAGIVDAAKSIIGNPQDMHTEKGVKDTVERLMANKKKMQVVSVTMM